MKETLAKISSLVEQMEKGELAIDQLSEFEALTRSLHERSIILRYKAFELKSKPESEPVAEVVEPTPVVEEKEEVVIEDVQEEIQEVQEEPESQPAFDFSMFDTASNPSEEVVEDRVEEPSEEHIIEEENQVVEAIDSDSFFKKLHEPEEMLGAHFTGKLDSLIGAFGLNERLRYINDLFDGAGDVFSEAIKELDGKKSMGDAEAQLLELASKHEWNPEEEVVGEFVATVRRRYA